LSSTDAVDESPAPVYALELPFKQKEYGASPIVKLLYLTGLACLLTQAPCLAQSSTNAEIDALTARVEKLEGTRAIKKLQRAFGFYVDRGLWPDAADLFSDDGT